MKKRWNKQSGSKMAAEEGFEPSQTESESVVLPLHNSARFQLFPPLAEIIIPNFRLEVKPFFKIL